MAGLLNGIGAPVIPAAVLRFDVRIAALILAISRGRWLLLLCSAQAS